MVDTWLLTWGARWEEEFGFCSVRRMDDLDGEVSLTSELYRSRGNFGGVVGSLEV
jgi:hypothetical protein